MDSFGGCPQIGEGTGASDSFGFFCMPGECNDDEKCCPTINQGTRCMQLNRPTTCPDGREPKVCTELCTATPCVKFPLAACRTDTCGTCKARFLEGELEVTERCAT